MLRPFLNRNKNELIIAAFFAYLIFILKSPTLNVPFHLDEISFYGGVRLILNNNFNPFVEGWWGYHPPLIYELAAVSEYWWGFSRISLRFLILIFSYLSLWFTYLLGRKLYDKEVGFFSSLLLFTCPLFFAQSGLFHLSIPLTALSVMSLYFYFQDKKISYLIAGSLLVLTKETGIFVIAGIAIYELIKRARENKALLTIKKFIFLTFPLIPFMVWLGLNRYYLGWFFWPYYKEFFFFSKTQPWPTGSIWERASIAFNYHYWWIITTVLFLSALLSLINPRLKKKFFNQRFLFLLLLPPVVFIFFSLALFLPRYMLFVYPLWLIAFVFSIKQMIRKKVIYYFVFSLIAILFITCWFNYPRRRVVWGGEMNLAYLDVIKAHQDVADFLQEEYPDSRILTTDLMAAKFTRPIYGYVSRELDVYYAGKMTDKTELLVIPRYLEMMPSTQKLFRLRDKLKPPLLKVISYGGEEVLIYRLQ